MKKKVLRKDECIDEMNKKKKDEILNRKKKVIEREYGNVMEDMEINSDVDDVLLKRNKEKEIIRKRLEEVIEKKKIKKDYKSYVEGKK